MFSYVVLKPRLLKVVVLNTFVKGKGTIQEQLCAKNSEDFKYKLWAVTLIKSLILKVPYTN